MRKDWLGKAIGQIDDDLIEEAEKMPSAHKVLFPRWVKISSIAATILLLLVATALILPHVLQRPVKPLADDLELLSFMVLDDPADRTVTRAPTEQEHFELLSGEDSNGSHGQIEIVGSTKKTFRATVKNMQRAPFIDLVVYLSWKDTSVVFNEGHGEYQCASTTVFEDGLWVTNIEFELDVQFDEAYRAEIEIRQITFLQSEKQVVDVSLEGKEDVCRMQLALVRSESFRLVVQNVEYEIVFSGKEVYAKAVKALRPDAQVLPSIQYLDYAGTHECPVLAIEGSYLDSNKNIQTMVIPGSVTRLDQHLFDGCSQMTNLIFGGTVEEWDERFDDGLFAHSCIPVHCKNGDTSTGIHQFVFGNSQIDWYTRICTTSLRSCSRCGKQLGGGEERHLIFLTEETLSFKLQLQNLSSRFEQKQNELISPFQNSFEDPVDLSRVFAIAVEFEISDFETLKACTSGKLEFSSSGQADKESFIWLFDGKLFDQSERLADNLCRISFCKEGMPSLDCNWSAITFAQMAIQLPEGSDPIAVKIKDITLFAETKSAHIHTIVNDLAVEPTCTQTGLTSGQHCETCGEILKAQTVVPAKGHIPVVVPLLEATCTRPGMSDVTYCSVCDEILSYEQATYYLDHEFKNGSCIHCGCSDGLHYLYDEDLDGYLVSDVGDCNLNDIVIPEIHSQKPVVGIGDQAFKDCGTVCSVHCPDTVFWIGDQAFKDCRNLTSIQLGGGLTKIQFAAFSGCVKLSNIQLPVSLKSIHMNAFEDCAALTELTIPELVEDIGSGFVKSCVNLASISVDSDNTRFSSENGVLFSKDRSTLVCYPPAKAGNSYLVPEQVNKIYDEAFLCCRNLKTVTLSDAIVEISIGAFEGCTSLTEIQLPSSLNRIQSNAFSGCVSLEEIVIPDLVESIGDNAFYHCTNLRQVNIPDGIKKIESMTFFECESLETILIPGHVAVIDDYAFGNCKSLKNLILSKGIKTIGELSFYRCTSLIKVIFPDTLSVLKGQAFQLCDNLETVTFLGPTQTMGTHAFGACEKLMHIIYNGTPEQWKAATDQVQLGLVDECVVDCVDDPYALEED